MRPPWHYVAQTFKHGLHCILSRIVKQCIYLLSYSPLWVICLSTVLILSLCSNLQKFPLLKREGKNANSLKSLDPWDPVLAHLSYDPFLHAPAFNQAFPSSCTVVTFCNMSRKDHFHIRHVNQWQEASLAHYRHWFLSLTSSPIGPGTCKTDRQTIVYCGLGKWDNL